MIFESVKITEARSEGSIELKLVRKPPKVSRGYGGGARGVLGQDSRVGEELSTRITTFALLHLPRSGPGSGRPNLQIRGSPEVTLAPIFKIFIFPWSQSPRCSKT